MASIGAEIEEGFENFLGNGLKSNATPGETEVDHSFDDFDDSFMLNDGKDHRYIKSSTMCKKILYLPICEGSSVRAWDVLLCLPTLTFMTFLVLKWKVNRRKLLASHSPVFRMFHAIVAICTATALLREVISMSIAGPVSNGVNEAIIANKILWIVLEFILLTSELIVLIMSIAGARIDTNRAMCKVLIACLGVSLIYHIGESSVEFGIPDPSFIVHTQKKFGLYGFGGSGFCMSSSACMALVYMFVLLMPLLPFVKQSIAMPTKPGFYQYCGFLLVLYLVRFAGSALVYFKANPNGLCLVNLTTFLYLTFYSPLVYSAFLSPFFKTAQPQLLFSYKAMNEEGDADDDVRATQTGSLQFSLDNSPNEVESQPIVRNPNANQPFMSEGLASPEIAENTIIDPLRY